MSEHAATIIWITEDGRYCRQTPEGECIIYIKASCAEGGEQALKAQLAEAEKREKGLSEQLSKAHDFIEILSPKPFLGLCELPDKRVYSHATTRELLGINPARQALSQEQQ